MINILIGPKGTGKTKVFIDMVNQAKETEKGNVVCITKGDRHTFDISSSIRLVNTDDFEINNIGEFYGLVSGIISQNYDITHIFVDSITKIASGSQAELEALLEKMDALCKKFEVQVAMTLSMRAEDAGDKILAFA